MKLRTHCWPNIQTIAWFGRNPILIKSNKFFDELEESGAVKCLETQWFMSLFHRGIWHTGKAMRAALEFIRLIFISGRNRVTRPAEFL